MSACSLNPPPLESYCHTGYTGCNTVVTREQNARKQKLTEWFEQVMIEVHKCDTYNQSLFQVPPCNFMSIYIYIYIIYIIYRKWLES